MFSAGDGGIVRNLGNGDFWDGPIFHLGSLPMSIGGCGGDSADVSTWPDVPSDADTGMGDILDQIQEAIDGAPEAPSDVPAEAQDAPPEAEVSDTVPDATGDMCDACENAEADVGPDAVPDGEEEDVYDGDVTPRIDYYTCEVVASNSYGYILGAAINSPLTDHVIYDGLNWTGRMWFTGSPEELQNARRDEPARTWPRGGQYIPDYARECDRGCGNDLTANYSAELAVGFGEATFYLSSLEDESGAIAGATIVPMTYSSRQVSPLPESAHEVIALCNPEVIAPNTNNEMYIAAQPPLEIPVNCDGPTGDECSIFSGQMAAEIAPHVPNPDWRITDPSGISHIYVECRRVE